VWATTATALVAPDYSQGCPQPTTLLSTVMHRQQQQAENFKKRLRENYLGFASFDVLQTLI
jgi:hypothetical protein